ncbi:hypothetical protein [Nocardia crassostreae]|uniref:hypothetical protein n=1 Tax=Nocardia crassostreae TaxID=53428 RepID=UPI0008342AEC|nr:hypothetical protein [Nocardia crassostreae]
MKKLGKFAIIGMAAAGILAFGAGMASADDHSTVAPIVAPGEPSPNGTGSSQALTDVIKALSSGSSKTAPTPATP